MSSSLSFSIRKFDAVRRVVYGVVYAPMRIDAFGGFATVEEVEKMAYRFMRLDLSQVIDVNHDNKATACFPVESFIARQGDPDFPIGSWVMGVKIVENSIWSLIESGELNAFSMEIITQLHDVEATLSFDPMHFGETLVKEDHTHVFYVEINESGRIVSGKTDMVNGHFHTISVNSVTDESNGHTHRYVIGN